MRTGPLWIGQPDWRLLPVQLVDLLTYTKTVLFFSFFWAYVNLLFTWKLSGHLFCQLCMHIWVSGQRQSVEQWTCFVAFFSPFDIALIKCKTHLDKYYWYILWLGLNKWTDLVSRFWKHITVIIICLFNIESQLIYNPGCQQVLENLLYAENIVGKTHIE